MLRWFLAPNASPMTLDGTRTYLIGRDPVAVIDPGSASEEHLAAIEHAIGDARCAAVLLTHTHSDHASGAPVLAVRLGCAIRGVAASNLEDGDHVTTDAGDLIARHTPGHTPDHVSFHWPAAGSIFCGDLMMGGLDTALVAPPEGDLAQYLASLERLRALRPAVIYPAHGPPFSDPSPAIARYIRHRIDREARVLAALLGGPLSRDRIVDAVYGDTVSPALRGAAHAAVGAYLDHLAAAGRVRALEDGRWARSDVVAPG